MAQLLANSPAGGPVEGEGGLFALKASDSSAAGYGVVGITAVSDILGDMRGTSPLDSTRPLAGVYGISDLPSGPNTAGVLGENFQDGPGVLGQSNSNDGVQGIARQPGRSGVTGINSGGGNGVFGQSETGRGVAGTSNTGIGVFGESAGNDGVQGESSAEGKSGVTGINSGGGNGVFGQSETGRGVAGTSNTGIGVFGESNGRDGVQGVSKGRGFSGVTGINEGGGRGLTAVGSPAGHFDGDVEVTGNINCNATSTITCFDVNLVGGDCAEDFDIVDTNGVEPGTVMVIDNEGALLPSTKAYDRKVAGVISGAGEYKPGIVLNKQHTPGNRKPIALVGKVYCKVDADYAPVEVGDLLTTSSTPGHAMKAEDPQKAFGAVIGKALCPLRNGQGLVPILIALQ